MKVVLEVSESKLSSYIVHGIEEQLVLGDEVFSQPEVLLEAAFAQLAFSKVKFEQQYDFFHETNLELNEIYTYAKAIFADEQNFLRNLNILLLIYIVYLTTRTLKMVVYLSGCSTIV